MTPLYKIVTVQSGVANGYCSTVVNTDTKETVFCSTISSYREHNNKKKVSPEAQAIGFIKRKEVLEHVA